MMIIKCRRLRSRRGREGAVASEVLVLASAPSLAALSAQAQAVTDRDTIKFGKERVRLWGIDAPEIHQICADRWLAGIEASRKLEADERPQGHLREPRL